MDSDENIILVSSDGKKFEISQKAAQRSKYLKAIMEDFPEDEEIIISDVKGNILKKIIAYLKHYENEEPREIPTPMKNFQECLSEWDFKYINIDLNTVLELAKAADILEIKPLLELTCAKFASNVQIKTADELKIIFGGPKDNISEEELKILEENK